MTIEDIFRLKGIVDNTHYVVLKTIEYTTTSFKGVKQYTIKVVDVKSQKEIYKVSLNSTNKEKAFEELEDKLIMLLLKKDGKYKG